MPRFYSAAEIAAEAACAEGRVRWLAEIGLLIPDEHGRFTFGAVLAVKMVSALMDSGITAETIEHAAAEGLLSFQLASEPVVEGAGGSPFRFERIEDADLKGLPDPVHLFRVTRTGTAAFGATSG